MTASLACFLGELLKAKNTSCSDSSFAEVLIVDDNAQLTPEQGIKNTISFANASGSCHLNSRWCSQPSLLTGTKQSFHHSGSSRRSSCTGSSCTTNDTAGAPLKNASWNNVLPHQEQDASIIMLLGQHDHSSSSPRSKLKAVEPDDDHTPSSNPLISINHDQKRRPSCCELDAPQVPKRSTSPGALQSIVFEKRKLLDRPSRNSSLHTALGGMAPKSSFTERTSRPRAAANKKKEFFAARAPRTTTMMSIDKKNHVGSLRQGTTKI